MSHCDVWSLDSLSVFGRAQKVVVCGTSLPAAVLQVKSEQAGEVGAASTSSQQGGDRLFEDNHSRASRH